MDDDNESIQEPQEPHDYVDSDESVGEAETEPDVLLDVPQLIVDEIALDVEELRARVSLQAEVLDLLKLQVGADVEVRGVHLDIKGVEAQALLKVRLARVAEIINRVLTTIDRNPQILEQLASTVGSVAGEVGEAVGDIGESVGAAVDRAAGGALEGVGEAAGGAVEGVGKVLGTSGRLVDKALGGSGPARRATEERNDKPDGGGGGTPRRPRRRREHGERPP
jgi:hypothetical protein